MTNDDHALPPAFVINLDSRPDRLATCGGRLRQAGVDFERMPALDPEQARIRDIRRGSPRIKPGELAVVASHLEIYRLMVERGLPHTLIMEDDVLPGVRFRRRLLAGLAGLPSGWMLYQAGWVDLDPLHRRSVSSLARAVVAPIVPSTDLVMAQPFRLGTHCYVASLELARYGLEHFTTPHLASDDLLHDHSQCPPLRGRCFVNLPSLALQDQSPSDIVANRHVAGFPAWRRWIS